MGEGWGVFGGEIDRGVGAADGRPWQLAESAFEEFLVTAGVRSDTVTWSSELIPVEFPNRDAAVDRLSRDTRDDGAWSFMTLRTEDEPGTYLLALPVTERFETHPEVLPFIELYSRATAWWLVNMWRTRELSRAATELASRSMLVASASAVRALVETVAAFDYDARRIRTAWSDMKSAGPSTASDGAWARRQAVHQLFTEVFYGSKFTDAAPELKEHWSDRVSRRNVLTQLKHHAKRVEGVDLIGEYEWLCNVVHPSIGTLMVYSSPAFLHDTGTHADRLWHEAPTYAVDATGERTGPTTVQRAVARAATTALHACVEVGRPMLRIIDDIALTSEAPAAMRRPVFRSPGPVGRNDACPCGSGVKWKRCGHAWGEAVPELPLDFKPQVAS